MLYDDEGGDGGLLPQAQEHLGLEREEHAREEPSPTHLRGSMVLDTLISDFWRPEQ